MSITKLIRTKFSQLNKSSTLSSIYQLRNCETECAINKLDPNKNENNFNSTKLFDESEENEVQTNKKSREENLPLDRKLKENLRIDRFKENLDLDHLDNEEALTKIKKFFEETQPGIRYFERTGSPVYGSNYNTIIYTRSKFNKMPQYKFIAAEQMEKNIIYDFSYEDFMNKKEKNSLIYQILICLGLNNQSKYPFPILFANLDKNTYTYEKLNDFYFTANKTRPNIKITDKSYLDLLPKEEIIYLSPHAEESLNEFNPNYHYVIGCFIDISFSKDLSFKKAQAEGIKSYRLPIDEYVAYSKTRNKLLPLAIVHQILLDKKMNTDWKFTLELNLGKKRIDLELDEVDEFTEKYKNLKKHLY